MKRSVCFFLLCALVITVCFSSFVRGNGNGTSFSGTGAADIRRNEVPEMEKQTASVLPSSLAVIEEEAFEGTALEYVILPAGLRVIEKDAFAYIPTLCAVSVPDSVSSMAESVFTETPGVVLIVDKESYASQWAVQNGIGFLLKSFLRSGFAFNGQTIQGPQCAAAMLLFAFAAFLLANKTQKAHARRPDEGKTLRPQERSELHAIFCRFP